jgi:hypothetical protein
VATLTPSQDLSDPDGRGSGASTARGGQARGGTKGRKPRTDIAPPPGRAVALWLRAVLDRPMTSYHLVLG